MNLLVCQAKFAELNNVDAKRLPAGYRRGVENTEEEEERNILKLPLPCNVDVVDYYSTVR